MIVEEADIENHFFFFGQKILRNYGTMKVVTCERYYGVVYMFMGFGWRKIVINTYIEDALNYDFIINNNITAYVLWDRIPYSLTFPHSK